ncbi:MAG: hypothetical protein DMF65_11870 [Acidobacteria bacterium]|nr:MAG: hypothetical protein DMF65_11870 [Acidobacteriota bacterium]
MSDEKRQTRLLPFRLRRVPRRAVHDFDEDATVDAELSALLRAWEAPTPSADAGERLLADFRAARWRAPLWRRALAAELRVPLPLAACALLALLALSALAALAWNGPAPAESKASEAAPALRVVEVPVPQERVVTRVVYVEKKERGESRAAYTRADADESARTDAKEFAQTGANNFSRAGANGPAAKANWHAATGARESKAEVGRSNAGAGRSGAGAPTSYFTRVDMKDFQPADELKIRIVKKGRADEK